MRSISAAQIVSLPGGCLRGDGACLRDTQLRPVSGEDEEWLLSLDRPWPQAMLVTELLARCVERIGPDPASREMVRSLAVGDRDFLLLKLHQISFGSHVELVRCCPHSQCGAKLDLDFDLDSVPIEAPPVQPRYEFEFGENPRHKIRFRPPQGADQEVACGWNGLRGAELTTRLLGRCVLELDGKSPVELAEVQALTSEARVALEREIERCSPKVHFEMEALCPQCGRTFSAHIDPASFVLQAFINGRQDFERDVHLLAFHYHWPPDEVLALPLPRRRRYLRFLLKQLDQVADSAFTAA